MKSILSKLSKDLENVPDTKVKNKNRRIFYEEKYTLLSTATWINSLGFKHFERSIIATKKKAKDLGFVLDIDFKSGCEPLFLYGENPCFSSFFDTFAELNAFLSGFELSKETK